MQDLQVVDAGPTGIVLALWLKWLGIRFRIINKVLEPGTLLRLHGRA